MSTGKTLVAVIAAMVVAAVFTGCGNSYLAVEGTVITGVKDRTKVPANVKIPNGITEISDHAFTKCKAIKSVTFPKSLEKIGMNAFEECDYLESVTIPASVTIIGDRAFMGCRMLTSVTFADPNNWHYTSSYGERRKLDLSNPTENARYLMHARWAIYK